MLYTHKPKDNVPNEKIFAAAIPIGEKTNNKPTYTRDDDPTLIHNTPIFYYIKDNVMNLDLKKKKIHEEQVETYKKAFKRLTTNHDCNVMLRNIIFEKQEEQKDEEVGVKLDGLWSPELLFATYDKLKKTQGEGKIKEQPDIDIFVQLNGYTPDNRYINNVVTCSIQQLKDDILKQNEQNKLK